MLDVLAAVADAPEEFARRDNYRLHRFALYLLAEFRERRAYPILTKLLRGPAKAVDILLGETCTDRLKISLGRSSTATLLRDTLACAVADLPAPELLPEVAQAFEEG